MMQEQFWYTFFVHWNSNAVVVDSEGPDCKSDAGDVDIMMMMVMTMMIMMMTAMKHRFPRLCQKPLRVSLGVSQVCSVFPKFSRPRGTPRVLLRVLLQASN